MRKLIKHLFALFVVSSAFSGFVNAQSQVVQDYNRLLTIPNLKALQASTSHLYALSESEGMAVFRVYADSLQWLYTSSGMQRRGDKIETDIRFAYLYGDTKRLTVLEPTSVLGVYSSTLLPEVPKGIARLKNELFIALGSAGLGKLSLETPETVDTEAEIIANDVIGRANVLDVASSLIGNQLFVLTDNSRIHVFTSEDSTLEFSSTVGLSTQIHRIFLDEGLIWGATNRGEVFEVNSNGLGKRIGAVGEKISDLINWRNRLFVRGISGKVWVSENERPFIPWKEDASAGNFITKSGYNVWISVYNKLGPLKITSSTQTNQNVPVSGVFKLKPINNLVLTYPKPLLLGIELEGNYPANDVEFTYHSNIGNATIKGQGFYWQPTVNQVGYNSFTIIANNSNGQIDSTRFTVDVRTFNAPPRFSPVRSSSIVVNDPYQLQLNAVDPENPANSIIRYLGVDLPDGATLDEQTGLFKWTPTERQVGESTFRVIATDELGAASSQDITLNVIDISGGGQ